METLGWFIFKKNFSNNTETESDYSELKTATTTTTATQFTWIPNDQSTPSWVYCDFTLFGTIGPVSICEQMQAFGSWVK